MLGAVNLGGRPAGGRAERDRRSRPRTSTGSATSSRASSGCRSCSSASSRAIPLVADREKLILKRLSATPLQRWQLVGSNVIMRLLIALAQTIIIVGVGATFFGVQIDRQPARWWPACPARRGDFISLGYVIASFATTEDAANGMTSTSSSRSCSCRARSSRSTRCPTPLKAVARFLPAHLPVRRAPPGDGQRRGLLAAVGLRRRPGRLDGRLLRHLGALLPVAVDRGGGDPGAG